MLVDHLADDTDAVIGVTDVALVHRGAPPVGIEHVGELDGSRRIGREAGCDHCPAAGQAA